MFVTDKDCIVSMKQRLICLFSLYFLVLAVSCTQVLVVIVKGSNGDTAELTEVININVNSTTADVYTIRMIISQNTSLIHFPSGVNMAVQDLKNVNLIGLTFSTAQSLLFYEFSNTDASTAKAIADSMKSSEEFGFVTSFTWNSTVTAGNNVNVTYTGLGKGNLTQYTELLMSRCLSPGLGGFSLTFLPMSPSPEAFTGINAYKNSGGLDWTYAMLAGDSAKIPIGSGNHTIDILGLLNMNSLAPSPYANMVEGYQSLIVLTIFSLSNETVSYVDCKPPGLVEDFSEGPGWMLNPYSTADTLMAYFFFGSDPTPVIQLKLIFGGTVVPEFTMLVPLVILMLATTIVLVAKRRLLRTQGIA